MLIKTLNDYDYSQIDDRLFNHNGWIVDVGCSGWDWSAFFIGKKRVIGIDPYEASIPDVTFFEGLLGPVNGMARIHRNGSESTVLGEMDLSNDTDYKTFPMMNWKTFKKTYGVENVSVLKLNIEGGEYALLMSLDEDDFQGIDQIVVSFHNAHADIIDKKTQAVIDYICGHGYSHTQLENKYGWFLFIKTEPDYTHFGNNSSIELVSDNVTIVTGLWDLGRGNLDGWAKRDFSIYKENFFRLLKSNVNMCIWIPRELEEDVWKIRSKHNTKIYHKELEDFKTWFPFYGQHEKIRTSSNWSNQVGWLTESPQAKLPEYNPMMMTKMFMVNDSAILNPFSTNYFYWMDGGLTSTVSDGYFTSGEIFKNISSVYDKSIVNIVYPYEPVDEIHGFHKNKFYENCELVSSTKQVLISRGGFWGGPKELIHKYNELYYSVLSDTILSGYVGADECLFTILAHKHPEIVEQFEIDGNGLVWPFFEAMQNVDTFVKPKKKSTKSTNLYVLGFNSPDQFERLCESFKSADENFLNKPRKILINNSTDVSTFDEYDRLCGIYGFEEIHFDNIGICGGRQFIAEHFDESGAEFYMFFEDDMLLNDETVISERCKMGFTKYIPNLYSAITNIIKKEQFDFLKFSFSEFYGDNSVQWSWYNVPQNIRTLNWPEYDKLPEIGLDPKSPKTKFSSIKTIDGVPVITGEIYYSNWPQIVSKTGNTKMFLTTKWPHPYEQTWMSYIYQETVAGNIHPAILLASTITHDRFDHYSGTDRREN